MTKTLLIALLLFAACSKDGPEPTAAPAQADPAPLEITSAKTELVFRFRDASGGVSTASTVADIPEASRKAVVVYDPNALTPAGWDYVVDLSNGLPATARAQKDFDFPAPAADPTPSRTASSGSHEVFLFSTEGCGYCAKARKYLKSNSVPYTELDLETNAGAHDKLVSMGKKAGLGASDMQGVPIMFVDGNAIVGWDQARLARLLGLGG